MRRSLALWAAGLALLSLFVFGCAEAVRVGTTIGAGTGKISKEEKERLPLTGRPERPAFGGGAGWNLRVVFLQSR